MQQKIKTKLSGLSTMNRIILVILMITLAVVTILFMRPQRSATAYCEVYKTENTKLANAKGDAYSVAVFSRRSSSARDFAEAFARLDKVAPSDIEPDVKILKSVFEKIEKDPSQALSASLSGISAESSVKKWTSDNCGL